MNMAYEALTGKEVMRKHVMIATAIAVGVVLTGNTWSGEASAQMGRGPSEHYVEKRPEVSAAPEPESPALFEKIGDMITFSCIIAGAYQYENPSVGEDDDFGRGALAIQPEVSISPTPADEIFFKLGLGAGNGLNIEKHPFALAPWAADLEDDVKDINGHNRDYLLTAWYKHLFTFDEGHTLGLSGGIIDATDYLDENPYANDEFSQFMNEALVNAPNAFLPSYDLGGALEWECSNIALKGVIMQIDENDEGEAYNFYGLELNYKLDTPFGEGSYGILLDATSRDFSEADGPGREALKGAGLSFAQPLGENLGAWIRFRWCDDEAAVDFKNLYSGGFDISGRLWGREQDNIGIGYARLGGGNQDIDRVQVAEAYLRCGLGEIFAVTLDVQYLDDQYTAGAGEDVDGWITGVRLTAEF